MNANNPESPSGSEEKAQSAPNLGLPPVHFTMILRIWRDDDGHVWGQVVEPLADRRTPFRGRAKLWRLLEERIQPSVDAAHPGQDEHFG